MQQRNNRLAVCAGALVAFICALFVKWYTITDRRGVDLSLWPNVEITGLHGSITLLVDAPVWLLLTTSGFFTLLLASNILGSTTVPWWVITVGLILPGIDYVAPLVIADGRVHASIGPALAIAATLLTLRMHFAAAPARLPRPVRGAPATNL